MPSSNLDSEGLSLLGWIEHGELALEHDGAAYLTDGEWRMPTINEFGALIEKCDWFWVRRKNVNGYWVQGKSTIIQ